MQFRFGRLRWVWLLMLAVCAAPLGAQPKPSKKESKSPAKTKPAATAGVTDFTSKNFLIHTDLAPDEAEALLKRMETMLGLISKYWGRPPVGVIECYVVKDLANWPDGALDERGLESIRGRAGLTIGQTITSGNNFISKATVYAIADRGTPLHEVVHAYCTHAFGRTGPVWYAEGMAEMGQYWREGDLLTVHAHDVVIDYLRNNEPKPLLDIVNRNESSGDSWQNYAWRWALCHLLCNNPNYAQRFRPLGIGLLTRQSMSFESVYGDMAEEIQFEYMFFIKHIEAGYRVDLTRWDWKAKFKPNKTGTPVVAVVDAGLGWQPSKLTVVQGEEYELSAAGTWTTQKDGPALNADGDGDRGKLLGVIMTDWKLGEPIELSAFGTFTAPADGNLYLRCQDRWNELADNKGKMTVKLKPKGKGTPLTPPGQSTARPSDSSAKTKDRGKGRPAEQVQSAKPE